MHPADLVYAIDKGRLLFTANVPGGVFPKGMLRDANQNPELASAKMQFIAFCVHREACYCSQNCAFAGL